MIVTVYRGYITVRISSKLYPGGGDETDPLANDIVTRGGNALKMHPQRSQFRHQWQEGGNELTMCCCCC